MEGLQNKNENLNYQTNIIGKEDNSTIKFQLKSEKLIKEFENMWSPYLSSIALDLCKSKLKNLDKNTTLSVLKEAYIKKTCTAAYVNIYFTLLNLGKDKAFKQNIDITEYNWQDFVQQVSTDCLDLISNSKFRATDGTTLKSTKSNILIREDSNNNIPENKKPLFGFMRRN